MAGVIGYCTVTRQTQANSNTNYKLTIELHVMSQLWARVELTTKQFFYLLIDTGHDHDFQTNRAKGLWESGISINVTVEADKSPLLAPVICHILADHKLKD